MLKNKIFELAKAGKTAANIAAAVGVSKTHVYRICQRYSIKLTKPQFIPWNKGASEHTNASVAKYTEATRCRMRSSSERTRRSQNNREMWENGRFKPNKKQLDKARDVWVSRIKNASPEERKKLLHNFTSAGNAAQSIIRKEHAVDIEWYNRKYPWADNPRIKECLICKSTFITTRTYPLCSTECYREFFTINENPNWVLQPEKYSVASVKCRNCGGPFLTSSSKWTKKHYCSAGCLHRWLDKHPNFTVKNRHYSALYGINFIYDSQYELDFILMCEKIKLPALSRGGYVGYTFNNENHKYYYDFITPTSIIEIKASRTVLYNEEKEVAKMLACMAHCNNNGTTFKVITDTELYEKKVINADFVAGILQMSQHFIGGEWKNLIKLQ